MRIVIWWSWRQNHIFWHHAMTISSTQLTAEISHVNLSHFAKLRNWDLMNMCYSWLRMFCSWWRTQALNKNILLMVINLIWELDFVETRWSQFLNANSEQEYSANGCQIIWELDFVEVPLITISELQLSCCGWRGLDEFRNNEPIDESCYEKVSSYHHHWHHHHHHYH